MELNSRQKFYLTPVLLVVDKNPKKKPSMSYDRFENYFKVHEGIDHDYTVQDCIDAGVRMDDIRHDSKHGFILLGEEAIENYRKENKPVELDFSDMSLIGA